MNDVEPDHAVVPLHHGVSHMKIAQSFVKGERRGCLANSGSTTDEQELGAHPFTIPDRARSRDGPSGQQHALTAT